jgi:hypothetical protein
VRDFFYYLLIDLLPFWQQIFTLLATVSWPLALIVIVRTLHPMFSRIFSDRGISFEGVGTQIRIDERKHAQDDSESLAVTPLSAAKLTLPRTVAIDEEETALRSAIEQLPPADRNDIVINALAIERLEKHFALTYVDIFGSQLVFLQKINERGSAIAAADGEIFFSEVKSRVPELSDWDFGKYCNYLVQRNLIRVSANIELTPVGKDFIHFVVRYGLRTDKGL